MISNAALGLMLATLAIIAMHTSRLIYLKRWNAFDPLNAFWAGVCIVYVVQPLSHGALYDSWHAPGIMEKTCFWVFFSMCFIVIGYESRLGPIATRCIPAFPERLHPMRMQVGAYCLIMIGLAGYLYQFASAGSFANWAARSRGGTDWNNLSAYLAQLADLLPLGIILLVLDGEMHIQTFTKRLLVWSLAGGMWVWFFYLGSRSRTILFCGAMLAAYYIPRRRNPSKWILAICAFVLFITSEFLGQYRYQFRDFSLNLQQSEMSSVMDNVLPAWLGGDSEAQKLAGGGGAEFNCVMAVIECVPALVPFDGGYALLELVTRPIPRFFWPQKRYPHYESFTKVMEAGGIGGVTIKTDYANLLAGPAFTFVGHWYAIGGPIALALMGTITGAFFRAIRGLYDRSPGEGAAILYMILAPIGFGEAAATPLFFLFSVPYTVLPALLFIRTCRISERRRHSQKVMRVASSSAV